MSVNDTKRNGIQDELMQLNVDRCLDEMDRPPGIWQCMEHLICSADSHNHIVHTDSIPPGRRQVNVRAFLGLDIICVAAMDVQLSMRLPQMYGPIADAQSSQSREMTTQ